MALATATFEHDDYILLQYTIVLKGRSTGLEKVHPAQSRVLENEISKRSIVGAVTKTAWDDGYKLAMFNQQGKR